MLIKFLLWPKHRVHTPQGIQRRFLRRAPARPMPQLIGTTPFLPSPSRPGPPPEKKLPHGSPSRARPRPTRVPPRSCWQADHPLSCPGRRRHRHDGLPKLFPPRPAPSICPFILPLFPNNIFPGLLCKKEKKLNSPIDVHLQSMARSSDAVSKAASLGKELLWRWQWQWSA